MTVSYSENVFTSNGNYGMFIRLLLRWKGSIYKLVWRDLAIYVVLYALLSVIYRFMLPPEGENSKINFIRVCSMNENENVMGTSC